MYFERKEKPGLGYFMILALAVMVGCWNCGIALSSNVDVADVLKYKLDWKKSEWDRNNTIISTSAVVGLSVGSMISKVFTEWGRRRTLLLSNLCIAAITIPYLFFLNYWYIVIAKFFQGVFGAFIVNASSLYMNEVTPSEYQSKVGVSLNLGIVFGIFMCQILGLALPDSTDKQANKDDEIWKLTYCLPLVSVTITTFLWLFVFRTEPLVFLMAKAEKNDQSASSAALKEAYKSIKLNHGADDQEQ